MIAAAAKRRGIKVDDRSFLIGYLFGRAAADEHRLLIDETRCRTYASNLVRQIKPPEAKPR